MPASIRAAQTPKTTKKTGHLLAGDNIPIRPATNKPTGTPMIIRAICPLINSARLISYSSFPSSNGLYRTFTFFQPGDKISSGSRRSRAIVLIRSTPQNNRNITKTGSPISGHSQPVSADNSPARIIPTSTTAMWCAIDAELVVTAQLAAD